MTSGPPTTSGPLTDAPPDPTAAVVISDADQFSNIVTAVNKLAGMKNPVAGTLANRIAGIPQRDQKAQVALFVRWTFQFLTVINMASRSKKLPSEFAIELDKAFTTAAEEARAAKKAGGS
jgi:hypothetical protein